MAGADGVTRRTVAAGGSHPLRTILLLACAAVSLAAFGAPLTDTELIESSDAIVVARLLSAASFADARGDIRTQYSLEVEQVLRGEPVTGAVIVLEELGGTSGGRTLIVTDALAFEPAERCLLFLRKSGSHWTVAGRNQGKLTLRNAATLEGVDGRRRDALKFYRWIRGSLLGARLPADYRRPRAPRVADEAVPSKYTKKGTRVSVNGSDYPIRWETFGAGLSFEYRGTQPDAANGGLDALQSAVSSWANDPTSVLPLTVGSSTNLGAVHDTHRTVQFNDPDNLIPGSYVEPALNATTGTLGPNGRQQHRAVFLGANASNKVLLAGGVVGGTTTNTALLYNPATQTFAATTNNMTAARKEFEPVMIDATELAPLVLIAGGTGTAGVLNSAEYFDTQTGSFSSTGTTLNTARSQYGATSLGPSFSNKILITGGYDGSNALATAELFDPANGSFTQLAATMTSPRRQHASVLMSDGDVLLVGGRSGSTYLTSIERFEPPAGDATEFVAAGTMAEGRALATATLLNDGSVLIVGGINASGAVDSAEVYPLTSAQPEGTLSQPRYGHTATLLSNGRVLIAGGTDGVNPLSSMEIYDPDTKTFRVLTLEMTSARAELTATRLADGKVLLAGGVTGSGDSNTADLFTSPPSFDLGLVKFWLNAVEDTHPFGGVTFQNIEDIDIVVQDGLSGAGMTNGGFAQLMANLVGQTLGFNTTFDPAILNLSFEFNSPPYGVVLQQYDREAAGYIYPTCPVISAQPQSAVVASGGSALLEVTAAGGGLLAYEWQSWNGTAYVPVGVTTSTYMAPVGQYQVVITNDCGSTTSDPVTVTVAGRGDINGTGTITSADIDALMDYYYAAGAAPVGNADVNSDGNANAADIEYLINHVHGGGPPPAP